MKSARSFGGAWLDALYATLAALTVLVAAAQAQAATRVEVLVIGNNQPPVRESEAATDSSLGKLHFADDDAAAFYEFATAATGHGYLLTLMDRETQALYPKLVSIAKVPTVSEVDRAVAEISQRLAQYKAEGDRGVVFIFFSGHGTLDAEGDPKLALVDGGITQRYLYEQILDRLPADVIHLFIDACHAEAVVRPRDSEAQAVTVSADEANTALVRTTLARYPKVGAMLAAASDSQTHEWSYLRQGVFTHELLSALRGGADVNQDGRIEYSEAYAFLSAANRAVEDPRARLAIVARPPNADRRVSIVDSAMFFKSKHVRLTAIPTRSGPLEIEDDAGRRLATLHGEPDFVASLWLPPERTIYLRSGQLEAHLPARSGATVAFASLLFAPASVRARGSIDDALRRGFFAMQFGRGYYSGFIDRDPDFIPVTPADPVMGDVAPAAETPAARPQRDRPQVRKPRAKSSSPSWSVDAGVGVSNTIANTVRMSQGLTLGLRPSEASGLVLSLDGLLASTAILQEWRGSAALGWLWQKQLGPFSGWLGASAGGGVIVQDTAEGSSQISPVGTLTPFLGVDTRIGAAWGIWSKAAGSLLVYQRDAAVTASVAPSVWLGGFLGF